MLDSLGLAGLLLPMGIALGWYLAGRYGQRQDSASPELNNDYLRGLAHLVNDDTDQAIAHFVKLIEVDDDTVETHLTLGNLFRRRGEVDRALRIHQNLIARPNLSPEHLAEAKFELAQDYLKAGLLDGAENLFGELIADGRFLDRSLDWLITIYVQERDWDKAIEASKRLAAVKGESQDRLIAHYLCEKAQLSLKDKDAGNARKLAEKALRRDQNAVRASLLLGQALEAQDNPAAAVKAYHRVAEQDPRYLTEALPALERCYAAVQDAKGFLAYLDYLDLSHASDAATLARARLLQAEKLDASEVLLERLREHPSWAGLHQLLTAMPEAPEARARVSEAIRGLLLKALDGQAGYECSQCGLHPRMLFWQCPSCKQWGSIAPSEDDLAGKTAGKANAG